MQTAGRTGRKYCLPTITLVGELSVWCIQRFAPPQTRQHATLSEDVAIYDSVASRTKPTIHYNISTNTSDSIQSYVKIQEGGTVKINLDGTSQNIKLLNIPDEKAKSVYGIVVLGSSATGIFFDQRPGMID